MRLVLDNSEQVKDRMNKLQYFLTIIVINPKLNETEEIQDFLVDTDEHYFERRFQEETKFNGINEIYTNTKGKLFLFP